MNCSRLMSWPVLCQNAVYPIEIAGFDDMAEIKKEAKEIVAVTDGWKDGSIAAILRGGVNARSVLDVMAQSGIKNITIFHIEESVSYLEDVFLSSVAEPANLLFENVSIRWRRDESIYELIKSIGQEYSMLFLGAPLAFSEILPFYQNIKKYYQGNLTIVRGPAEDVVFDHNDGIYKWVRERTFEAEDFSFCGVLKKLKKDINKKVAVLLPSLNEEKTVGNVIKAALEVKEAGIIDEVILIDSGSNDRTVDVASEYEIPVFVHQIIRPDLGQYVGKGEAMYKSAYVTDADIVVWVDTDIESITAGFFYGLLGPMFTSAEIRFVKGYFERPVSVQLSGVELGGGRVTELLVRPWINVFMPELSGFIQPLSGTVAIYREDLLKMRIPVNYGVEIAMLIQMVEQHSIWSTCQVNLGIVVHRSKDVSALSEMSFQILQALAEFGYKQNDKKANNTLRRFYSKYKRFEIASQKFDTVWREYEK